MANILYVQYYEYDVCLDLDQATSIQRFSNRIIIHFHHPDETFTIYDDKDEFHIINDYFEDHRKGRLKLVSRKDPIKENLKSKSIEDNDEYLRNY